MFKINHPELNVLDSDSSLYSKDETFPYNYLEHIKENIGKADVILVSSHKVVRDALNEANLEYTAVFPLEVEHGDMYIAKSEYIKRYRDRGNTEDFINLISKNWRDWITDIAMTTKNIFPLQKGEYIEHYWQYLKDSHGNR